MSEHNVWTTDDPETIRREIEEDVSLLSYQTGWDVTRTRMLIDQKLRRLSELVGHDVSIGDVLN